MVQQLIRLPFRWLSRISMRPVAVVMFGALAPALVFSASAQQADQPQHPATAATAQTSAPTQNPGPSDASTQASTPNASTATGSHGNATASCAGEHAASPASAVSPAQATVAKPAPAQGSEITGAEVKQLLVGKQLFLLGGYLNDNLSFNEHGVLIGRSPRRLLHAERNSDRQGEADQAQGGTGRFALCTALSGRFAL